MMQKLFFFVDDSGVMHKNEQSGWFVYAGYVFNSMETKEDAKRKYIGANKCIKKELSRDDEIKAYGLAAKHKRALYNATRSYESFSVAVNIDKVYDSILGNKMSICRFKDFILKVAIRRKIENLIARKMVNPNEDTQLHIFVDEQLTASSGYYSLRDSVYEELKNGIYNYDYSKRHNSIFKNGLSVKTQYCDSKCNYLIQASDILANKVWKLAPNDFDLGNTHFHFYFPY